tara:strand:- start:433 stop:1149 length:717 start_codon:yes stop_codon:yes gene_type:complete
MNGIELLKKNTSQSVHNALSLGHSRTKIEPEDIQKMLSDSETFFSTLCALHDNDRLKAMQDMNCLAQKMDPSIKTKCLSMSMFEIGQHFFHQSFSKQYTSDFLLLFDTLKETPTRPIIDVIGQLIDNNLLTKKDGNNLLDECIQFYHKGNFKLSSNHSALKADLLLSSANVNEASLLPFYDENIAHYRGMAYEEGMCRSNGSGDGRFYESVVDAFEKSVLCIEPTKPSHEPSKNSLRM